MRMFISIIGSVLLAGCASAPATDTAKIYDHKYGTTRSVAKAPESEFVGTGAGATRKAPARPSWIVFGHP